MTGRTDITGVPVFEMKPGETLTISRQDDVITVTTNRSSGRTTRRTFLVEQMQDKAKSAPTHICSGVTYRSGRQRLFKLDASGLTRAINRPKGSPAPWIAFRCRSRWRGFPACCASAPP